MDKCKNKYRNETNRAQWFDYSGNGSYFITICTKNREHYFGEIIQGKMKLSGTGVIAHLMWQEIPNHSKHVELGEFVVMPNHIHGILMLNKPIVVPVGALQVGALHATPPQHATPRQEIPQQEELMESSIKNQRMSAISPKSNSVSALIRSYKSAVTKQANQLGLENGWQSRFYDHIIRNDYAFQRISNYIINNPKSWKGN